MADVASNSDADSDSLHALARQVLHDNDRGGYTVPSSKLYPFQWNWDSAFVALGWAEFDRHRAWLEVEKLFEAQWPSGMVPHIVFWSEEATYFPGPDVWRAGKGPVPSSGISQPPVMATVVRRLVELDEAGGLPRAEALIESIDRWHQWWHTARDPQGLGVIAVAHPWESGRDNLPDWDGPLENVDVSNVGVYQRRDLDVVDSAMRPHKHDYDRYLALVEFGADRGWDDDAVSSTNPFWVADPATTAILLRSERDLKWLSQRLGHDTASIEARIQRLHTGYEHLWNAEAGAYCSLDLRTNVFADTATSASFLAPYAGVTDHLDEICSLLESWTEHCTYLVPSFDPRHPAFEANRYWRGPVWSMVNYMICWGLIESDRPELAALVKNATSALVGLSGFPESFNPLTGEPVGGPHFAWTAALWLSWAGVDS
jgi:hypothetical protein